VGSVLEIRRIEVDFGLGPCFTFKGKKKERELHPQFKKLSRKKIPSLKKKIRQDYSYI
jgi:hypothetical protein